MIIMRVGDLVEFDWGRFSNVFCRCHNDYLTSSAVGSIWLVVSSDGERTIFFAQNHFLLFGKRDIANGKFTVLSS